MGYVLSYWTQLLLVFSFLVILPLGEHFHIVTALPTLYFRRGRPANRVPSVDLEKMLGDDADAADLRVGARTAKDLTWKEGLDVFTCTECGRCKDACPTFLTGKPLSQKWVHDSLKHHLLEQRENIVTDQPAADALPPLAGGVISDDTLMGVHDVRLLRGGVPDRTRASSAVLPHAPAPRDDGRRVSA